MNYKYTYMQYLQLETLAFNIFLIKHKATDERQKKVIDNTIKYTFNIMDNMNIPMWVQNIAIQYGELKLRYKMELKDYLAQKGITPKDKHRYYE